MKSTAVLYAGRLIMRHDPSDVFVILRWPDASGGQRYSFATGPHAAEMPGFIERIQVCDSLQEAAMVTAQLNAAGVDQNRVGDNTPAAP